MNCYICVLFFRPSDENVVDLDSTTIKLRDRVFVFNKVFGPHSTQLEVYQAIVMPMIDELLLGFNCTLIA
jgi:kinesin family protein 11